MNRAWIIAPAMGAAGVLIAGVVWMGMNPTASETSAVTTTTTPAPPIASPREVHTAHRTRPTVDVEPPTEPDQPRHTPARRSFPELERLQGRLDGVLQMHLDMSELRDDATIEEAEDHMRGLTSDLSNQVQSLAREYRQVGGSIEQRAEALGHAANLYDHLAGEIERSELPRGLSPEEANDYERGRHQLVEATRSKANVLRDEVQTQ
ncbi:MAG: hypothetical protein ACI9MC_002030 [Kiritimatiellia bacterium]|jgi:hypothetical protein